jgi:hypothetical protein
MYVINTIVSAAHFCGQQRGLPEPCRQPAGERCAAKHHGALTWPAGAFSYRIQQAPAFPPINGDAARWVPLTTPDVNPERYPGYKQGSSIELRYWATPRAGRRSVLSPSSAP